MKSKRHEQKQGINKGARKGSHNQSFNSSSGEPSTTKKFEERKKKGSFARDEPRRMYGTVTSKLQGLGSKFSDN